MVEPFRVARRFAKPSAIPVALPSPKPPDPVAALLKGQPIPIPLTTIKEDDLTDTIITCEDGDFAAQRYFLVRESEFFQKVFVSGMMESQLVGGKWKLKVPDFKVATLNAVFVFIRAPSMLKDAKMINEYNGKIEDFANLVAFCHGYLFTNLLHAIKLWMTQSSWKIHSEHFGLNTRYELNISDHLVDRVLCELNSNGADFLGPFLTNCEATIGASVAIALAKRLFPMKVEIVSNLAGLQLNFANGFRASKRCAINLFYGHSAIIDYPMAPLLIDTITDLEIKAFLFALFGIRESIRLRGSPSTFSISYLCDMDKAFMNKFLATLNAHLTQKHKVSAPYRISIEDIGEAPEEPVAKKAKSDEK